MDLSLVSAVVFKKMYPPPAALPVTTKSPRDTFGNSSLMNVKSFSDITGQWLTMEAIFTTTQPMLTRKDVYLYAYDCQEYCRIHVQWLTVFFVSQSHDHLLVAINMLCKDNHWSQRALQI